MDLLFIDLKLDSNFTSLVADEVGAAFGSFHKIDRIHVSGGESVNLKLRKEKQLGYVGSFAVIVLEENAESFGKTFPNNTIIAKTPFDESEVKRVSKQVIWMLNNFGRERKNMTSNTWVISDTHFYHDRIIEYCNRPYANAVEMNEDMITKWNAVVGKDDVVWHLGDFCFGCKEHVKEIVPRLNGRINLVLGNHDHHKMSFYYESGFHRVYDHPVVISNFFILSHEPLQWVPDNTPMCNIFGHVHQQQLYKTFTPRTVCVCVERWNYTPIRWSDMVEKMNIADTKSLTDVR